MRRLASTLLVAVALMVATGGSPSRPAGAGNARPVAYLTFDDGPNPYYTPQVLDLLDRYHARATFFMVGKYVSEQAPLVDRIIRGGHAVGNHSWAHENFLTRSDADIRTSVRATAGALASRNYRLTCIRPPYGGTDARVNSVLVSEGYSVHLWDVDSFDWKNPDTNAIVANVERRQLAGRMILMHDGGGNRSTTVAALTRLLAEYSSVYDFQPMPSCEPPATRIAARQTASVAAPAAGSPVRFTPLEPRRILDTRTGGGRIGAGETMVVRSSEPGAALAVNLTVTEASGDGFVTAWDCVTSRPATSQTNSATGLTRAVASVVPTGPDGSFCVYSSVPTHLVVDLTGVFRPSGLGFNAQTPARIFDSRARAARVAADERIVLAVAPDWSAVALNLTVTEPAAAGFVTVYPCALAGPPSTSNINFAAGQTVANLSQVMTSDGAVCLFTSAATHIVVDVVGGYGPAGSAYQPAVPSRVLDTRLGVGGWLGRVAPDQIIDTNPTVGSASLVTGVVATVTSVDTANDGYLVTWPCGEPRPNASTLNPAVGVIVPNATIGSISADGAWCISGNARTNVVVDVMGWFVAPRT